MKVLVAVDGSRQTPALLEAIRRAPWPGPSEVRLLTVVPSYHYPMVLPQTDGASAPEYEPIYGDRQRDAERLVAGAAQELGRTGLRVDTAVRKGDPKTEIVEEARGWGADLIVLGSHGHGALRRWLLGSVAEAVARAAPCSVQIVRDGGLTDEVAASP